MSPNETNVDKLRSELNYDYESIIIPFYIEYIMLIANIINRVKSLFYIGKILPPGFLHLGYPVLNCRFCFRMALCV